MGIKELKKIFPLLILLTAAIAHAEEMEVYVKSPRFIIKTVEIQENTTAPIKETVKINTETGEGWILRLVARGYFWVPVSEVKGNVSAN